MKANICAIILSLLLISCSLFESDDDFGFWYEIDDPTLKQDSTILPGIWNWKRSIYYFTSSGKPEKTTPQTTGFTETFVFKTDGTVFVYRNDEFTTSHNYTVGTWSVYFNNTEYLFGVNESKLVLSTAYVDGPEKVYFRSDE